jgi:FkbM family methyltransferase
VSLDVPLARLTRRVPRFRGWHRMLEPLRQHYAKVYRERADRWIVIDDFQGDLRIGLDRSGHIGSAIYWRGIHSFAEAQLIRDHLPVDGVFLDVGANQGELTLIAARQARRGRVIAFEPVPRWFAMLEENVRRNGWSHVTVVNRALSDREAEVEMYTSEEGRTNEGLSSLRSTGDRNVPVATVSTLPLDAFVEREGLSRVDLIKIDVEGAERAVIDGASRTLERFRPNLILEWNEPATDPEPTAPSLRRDLRAQGYALFTADPFARLVAVADGAPILLPTVWARHESRV